MTVDNFAGHQIAYEPTNVQIEFFKPNLTAFVQPLDAGVIRCFKAYYCHSFCSRALDLDDAGERDIYKVNLLEAMLMAKRAWNAVTSETISNCWDHTGIQRAPIILHIPSTTTFASPPQTQEDRAWHIIEQFATTSMSLPEAKAALENNFGAYYNDEAWRPVLSAITAHEGI